MTRLLALTILLTLVLIGARRDLAGKRMPEGLKLLLVTGSEFLIAGAIAGPMVLGLLDEPTLRALRPFSAVGLGFVGLHYGLQLDLSTLRAVPFFYKVGPHVQAIGGALAVGIPGYVVLRVLYGPGTETTVAALVLAAAGACSTPAPLELLAREKRHGHSALLMMLRHLAEMGELPALALFGLALCWRHDLPVVPGWDALVSLQWLVFSGILALAFAVALRLLPRVGRGGTGRLLVAGLGAILFFTGLARHLQLSPLFVGLLAGAFVANLPGGDHGVGRFVRRTEGPFTLFLLFIAGASWRLGAMPAGPQVLFLLATALMLVRLGGKAVAGWVLTKTTHAPRNPPPSLGFGLVAQGGISAALALDYLDSGAGEPTALVVTLILVSVIATELVAPWMILKVLHAEPEPAEEGA